MIAAARLSILAFAVAVLLGCWALMWAGASLWWLFCFYGIILGPAVMPVVLAYLWERGTAAGFSLSTAAGTVSGLVAWLVVGLTARGTDASGLGLDSPDALMWGNISAYTVSTACYVAIALSSRKRFSFASVKPGLPLYAQDVVRE